MRASPDVGGSRPSRILMRVDLPAPFAPTRPTTPVGISTVRSDRAVTVPNCFVTPRATMAGPSARAPARGAVTPGNVAAPGEGLGGRPSSTAATLAGGGGPGEWVASLTRP